MSAVRPLSSPDVRESRRDARFNLVQPCDASFSGTAVSVLNVSGGGLQIEHTDRLKVGSMGTVRLSISSEQTAFSARVVWSRLSTITGEGGELRYRSGLRIEQADGAAYGFLGRMIRTMGKPDCDSLEKKKAALAKKDQATQRLVIAEPVKPRYTPDQLLLILQAHERLSARPEDARLHCERAKATLAERKLPAVHKPQVLAVWSYLGESLEMDLISMALEASQG